MSEHQAFVLYMQQISQAERTGKESGKMEGVSSIIAGENGKGKSVIYCCV